MGKAAKTRKFAVAKKIIAPKDQRLKANQEKEKKKTEKKEVVRHVYPLLPRQAFMLADRFEM